MAATTQNKPMLYYKNFLNNGMRFLLILSVFLWSWTGFSQPISNPVKSAQFDFIKGDSLLEAARHEESIKHFLSASSGFQKSGLWQKHFRSLNKISENYQKLGEIEKSLSLGREIVVASTEKLGMNNREEAMAYNHMGTAYGLKKDYSGAMDYFNKAEPIQKSLTGDERFDLSRTYNNMGVVYRRRKNYTLSQEFFQKSLEIKQAIFGKSHLGVAKTYNNLGKLYSDKGDYARAEDYLEKSLAIRLKLLDGDHPSIGSSYYNLAKVSENVGDYSQALEYNNKALYFRRITDGENHKRVGAVYSRIGLLHAYNQDYTLALEYLGKSLAIKKEQYGEIHRYVAREHGNIGTVYENQGNYQQALEHHETSLEIYKATVGENDAAVSFVYNNLGVVNDLLGNRQQAMEFYQRSLRLREEVLEKQNPRLAFSYRILGWAYQERKDYPQALKFHQKAADLREQVLGKKHPDLAKSFFDLADVHLQMGNYQNALKYSQKAMVANVLDYDNTSIYSNPPLTNFLEQYVLLNSLQLKASVFQKLYEQNHEIKDLTFSLNILEISDLLIGLIRKNHLNTQDKIALGKESPRIYSKAVEVCHELYEITKDPVYHQKAFYFSEKSKAGVLQLALSDNTAKNFGGIPNALLALEKKFIGDKDFYHSLIQQEKKNTRGYDSLLVRGYERDLFNLSRKSDSLALTFEKNYPKYHELKYQTRLSEIHELQNHLSDDKSALVEYFISDGTLFVFTIAKNHFEVFSSPLVEDFRTTWQQFRTNVTKRRVSKSKNTDKEFVDIAYSMYQQLFAPVKKALPDMVDNVTIIPHGVLSLIPFELMISVQSKEQVINYRSLSYLLKDYQISYAYSATIWGQEQRQEEKWENQFAGYAPSYQTSLLAEAQQLAPYGNFRDELTNLKYTSQEVLRAATFFKSSTFAGEEASERHFKKDAGKFQILHLAMHAIIDAENSLQSKLIFSQNQDSIEDGFLNAYELYNMDLNAELVVLSACNTGFGKLQKGEGVMSLGRAFAYAGCPSIVMSLWPAQDQATADIMTYFYEGLSQGQSKDQALQEAKLKYLEKSEDLFAHPFYWAGFVVQGDPSPLQLEYKRSIWWILAPILVISLVIFIWIYRRETSQV